MKFISSDILYLDDEQQNLDIFAAILSKKFSVHIAINFSEAINILQENKIKVVLTDQRMPDITGFDFIKYVKEHFPDIECIIITGYAEKDILFKSINEIDVFRFLEKPMQFDEIRHTIGKAIEKYDAIKEKEAVELKLKMALEKAKESDRLKAEFLSSISHEIRTPVNGIIGFSEIIKENKKENIPVEYLEVISNSALRLVDIVDDMVLASKINTGEIKVKQHEIFLNDLLTDLYDTYLPQVKCKGDIKLKLEKRKGELKIPITSDREKMYNIFIHLLRNALKYTHGGVIEFGIYDEQEMILYVKDTGIGISETDKPFIFEFFTQGKHKPLSAENNGIGLGLSIVKGLVGLLQGEIWFESEKEKGTTFYFTFHKKE